MAGKIEPEAQSSSDAFKLRGRSRFDRKARLSGVGADRAAGRGNLHLGASIGLHALSQTYRQQRLEGLLFDGTVKPSKAPSVAHAVGAALSQEPQNFAACRRQLRYACSVSRQRQAHLVHGPIDLNKEKLHGDVLATKFQITLALILHNPFDSDAVGISTSTSCSNRTSRSTLSNASGKGHLGIYLRFGRTSNSLSDALERTAVAHERSACVGSAAGCAFTSGAAACNRFRPPELFAAPTRARKDGAVLKAKGALRRRPAKRPTNESVSR